VLKEIMRLVKLEYERVDEVSYWVDLSLGQGEFPRDPSLIHVKWVKWLGLRFNGHRAHEVALNKALSCEGQVCIASNADIT
jgi:hypothetical protein